MDLQRKNHRIRIPQAYHLISLDVTSLYTSISLNKIDYITEKN